MRRLPILALAPCLVLCGCYSEHWRQAEVLVTTVPPGAACTLTRGGRQIAEIPTTPGIAMVSRSGDDIAIDCRREGYRAARAVSHALGNAVDLDTLTEGRSGYDYQSPVNLALTPAPETARR